MSKTITYQLQQDKKGMLWDLALYIPTVVALLLIGLKMWFGSNQSWAYLLFFMSSFFFFAGFNRVFSGRLMLMPGSPVAITQNKNDIVVRLRNGKDISLVKDIRFFADYAGKSFGLTGGDLNGAKRSYVFYRGQFVDAVGYKDLTEKLAVFK